MKIRIKYKRFIEEKQAVAGVIEAILLIALVAIIISIIQIQYIPEIMEEREADHMDEVSNQFSYLKAMIDIQALAGTIGVDLPLGQIPILTQITLGSKELPYFVTAPSYGELSIEENTAKIMANPPIDDQIQGIPFSSIFYHAYNMYFIPQTYIFEGGGIILNQSTGGSVMRADPSISIRNMSDKIEMKFYLPNIIGISGKKSNSGIGGCYIRTNYSSYKTYSKTPPVDNSYVLIYTNYLNAWNQSLNRIFGEEIKNGYVNIAITQHNGKDVVKIMSVNKPVVLDLTVVDIYGQVGPGWVI